MDDREEAAIAMLKPDAQTRGLADRIVDRLYDAGFREEARRTLRLTHCDIARLFLHPLPAYVAHLRSGPVTALLLRGPGGAERLYACKTAIRAEFGVTDRVRNLVHGADAGVEHHLLLDAFFPDRRTARYGGGADLDLRFAPATTTDAAGATLDALDAGSTLRDVVLTLDAGQGSLAALTDRRYRRLRVHGATLVRPVDRPDMVMQMRHAGSPPPVRDWTIADLAALANDGGDIGILDLPIARPAIDRYAADLRSGRAPIDTLMADYPLLETVRGYRRAGVRSLAVYRPGLTLMETELRGDLARLAGLHPTGGSAGRARPGRFTVSRALAAPWN